MWRAYGRIERLSKALEYSEIDPEEINIYDLKNTLIKRGITDSKLCDIYDRILSYLEPKNCQMCHCESHGVDGFCNCCKNLVPLKCKKHREFLKRCRGRAILGADQILEAIGDLKPLINYDLESYQFFDSICTGIEEKEALAIALTFATKWSSRLQSDVWDEVKRRKKNGGL